MVMLAGARMLARRVAWLLVVVLLLSPLFAVLVFLNSIGGIQLIYVKRLRVVNCTSKSLRITPVGWTQSGKPGVLYQFVARGPALPVLLGTGRALRAGTSRCVYFDRKGLHSYALVLVDESGECRQITADGVLAENQLGRVGDKEHVIEVWEALPPAADEVLAAARGSDPCLGVWLYILLGGVVLVFYCWLFEIW
jgi:hypothetical protein